MHIRMPKNFSPKYYQKYKERLQKACKIYQNISKEEKGKSGNKVMNVT